MFTPTSAVVHDFALVSRQKTPDDKHDYVIVIMLLWKARLWRNELRWNIHYSIFLKKSKILDSRNYECKVFILFVSVENNGLIVHNKPQFTGELMININRSRSGAIRSKIEITYYTLETYWITVLSIEIIPTWARKLLCETWNHTAKYFWFILHLSVIVCSIL